MLISVRYLVLEIRNLMHGILTSFNNSKRHIPVVQVSLFIC